MQIPAGTMRLVTANCPNSVSNVVTLLEPLSGDSSGGLPAGILISPALLKSSQNTPKIICLPVVNVSTETVYLPAKVKLGSLVDAEVISQSDKEIVFEENVQGNVGEMAIQTDQTLPLF